MVSPVFSMLWEQLKYLKPSFVSKKPHFNFITVHYFWVIGIAILASILIFASGSGEIAYIDALFFAAGANTQAGLNPVDVNKLNTFQQVVIMICSMISNPIAINSFVVFLRLFWFEKRFQDLVREARTRRTTLTKSRSKAKAGTEHPMRGVNMRDIRVMHDGTRKRMTNDGFVLDEPNGKAAGGSSSGVSPGASDDQNTAEEKPPGITFSDTVKRSDGVEGAALKEPATRSDEEHIAIVQRQRNTDNDEVLRIPGPRDVEMGERPRRVDGGTAEEDPEPLSARGYAYNGGDAQAPARPKGITIQEPAKKPSRREEFNEDAIAFLNVFTPFKFRRPRLFNTDDDKLHHQTTGGSFARARRNTVDTIRSALSRDKYDLAPYLSWQPTLGRNSAFVGELTDDQREELGGIEYRSLKTLSLILTLYFWGFFVLSIIMLTPWILHSPYGAIVDADGQSRAWWGIFTGSSAFTDLGFTLTPDSMNSFNTAVFPLLVMSFFIVIGNTGFPVMLRFIIWVSSLCAPRGSGLWEELRFLLDHPRRCFTLLFPSAATWWLFWLLVILNGLDLLFFVILDLGSGVVANLSPGIKVLDGAFQAFSTRTAGFACVNLAELHPGVQTSYLIMMYISIFPIAISVRRTNVYEEKSLGIYHEGGHVEADEHEPAGSLSYVGAHLRRQLSFDLWYIFIGFFILSISEGPRIQNNDFSMFAILFEIVSAYGTVGLSLGYPGIDASLSSQFTTVGKLVIIAMQIRGRHRGLPYGLDRAVLLPSETRYLKESEEPALPKARTLLRCNSAASVATDGRSLRRGRSRSISENRVDRVNSNLLTSFLHPGPAIPPHAPRRPMSGSAAGDEDHGDTGLEHFRTIPTRSETFSLSRRSEYNTRTREEV